MQIATLLTFRGLESFTVHWRDECLAETPEQKQQLAKMKRQTQALVDDIVTRNPETPRKRALVPTFSEALRASIAARKCETALEPSMCTTEDEGNTGRIVPLEDHDIPKTDSARVRLMHVRPRATWDYLLKTKAELEATKAELGATRKRLSELEGR